MDPTERLDELIEKGVGPIKDLGKITKKEFHYGLIPNEGLSRKTVYDNLILVGDTAGMANPLGVGGNSIRNKVWTELPEMYGQ